MHMHTFTILDPIDTTCAKATGRQSYLLLILLSNNNNTAQGRRGNLPIQNCTQMEFVGGKACCNSILDFQVPSRYAYPGTSEPAKLLDPRVGEAL
jgi:hypothetical protein